MAIVTGCIKNMMGTMAQKGGMHPGGSIHILHKRLRDLYQLTSQMVNFNVIDGIIGSAYSEQNGVPVQSGILLSGTDQWEIDCQAALCMGINPKKIPYLSYIQKDKKQPFPEVSSKCIKKYELPLKWRHL
jgi:uncharacterized protein (DUF362 family)